MELVLVAPAVFTGFQHHMSRVAQGEYWSIVRLQPLDSGHRRSVFDTRPDADVDRFTGAPPARRMVLGDHLDIVEFNVGDIAALPVGDSRSATALNDASLEANLRDVVKGFRADCEAGVATCHATVFHGDVLGQKGAWPNDHAIFDGSVSDKTIGNQE